MIDRAATNKDARPRAGLRRGREVGFLLPAVALGGLVIIVPTVSILYFSLTAWRPGAESAFVGLANYLTLFQSEIFWRVMGNQVFLLLGLPLWVFVPLVIAVALHERVWRPGIFRSLVLLPATVAPAIVGILFTFLLGPRGPVNELLGLIGLEQLERPWLSDPNLVRPVIILVILWWATGTSVLIYSSALTALPTEMLEAAHLDGAGWWRRFFSIIAPNLRETIWLVAFIKVILVFVGLFPWIFTLTRGGPNYSSTTLDYFVFQLGFEFGFFGQAAAAAAILLAFIGVVLAILSIPRALVAGRRNE